MAVQNKEMLPYREMDEASRTEIAVLFAKKKFDLIEVITTYYGNEKKWTHLRSVADCINEDEIYRTKPIEIKVPWEFIRAEWVSLAMDKNGKWCFYSTKTPKLDEDQWGAGMGSYTFASQIANLPKPDEINWKDSLTLRPESE